MWRRTWFRILVLTVSGLLLLGLLLVVSVYFILKSPAMQQKIVHSLKEPLQKQGVDLEVQSLSLDLFAGVHLQGLDVKVHRPPEIDGSMKIDELALGYAFWPLLHKQLEVREARFSGITGDFNLKPGPSKPEPPEEPKDPEALTKALDLLRNPPATVDLPNLILEKVNLRIHLDQDPMVADVQILDLSLEAAMKLVPGKVAADLKAKVPVALDFHQGQELTATTRVSIEPTVQFEATLKDQDFAWDLRIPDLLVHLDPTHVTQGGKALVADVKELDARAKLAANHAGALPKQGVTVLDLALPIDESGGVSVKGREIALVQAGQKTVSVPSLKLDAEGDIKQGKGPFKFELTGDDIRLKQLLKALDVHTEFNFDVDQPGRLVKLDGGIALNHQEALKLRGSAQDQGNLASADIHADVKTYPAWKSLHAGFQNLDLIDWPFLTIDNQIKVQHEKPLEQTDDWSLLTITNSLQLKAKQTTATGKALAKFESLALNLDARTHEKKAQGKLALTVDKLRHKLIKKAVAVHQDLDFDVAFADLLGAKLKGATALDGKDVLALTLEAAEKPHHFHLTNSLKAKVDPSFKQYMDGLDILDDVSGITLDSDVGVDLDYPAARIKDVKNWDPKTLNATVQAKQIVTQDNHTVKYRLYEPLTVVSAAKLLKAKFDLATKINAPHVEAKDLAAVSKIDGQLDVSVNDIDTQDQVEVSFNAGIKAVKPLMAAAEKVQDVVQNVALKLKARVLKKDRFVLDDLLATVDGNLVNFHGKGDMALSTGRGGFAGSLKSTLPEGREVAGLKGKGSFEFPINLTLYDKKVLALQSEPRFNHLSFTYGDIAVDNMDGRVNLAEELSLDEEGRIGFLYLNTQNPFTRVDFENVDPYLGQRVNLNIQKVRFKHILAGPITENFELRQNLILLNDLKANLLNGSALGRVFIDLHPERLQLGFLGRFSNLQPELLKEPARRRKSDGVLSGRAAANFDIRKRLATGRIDVTSIGRAQLLSMIDVLDPDYKDTQMMTARRALQVSYPSLVSISMEQGLMDLLIGLGGAISTDISIRSIPLTAFINANAGEQLLTVEKFLQTGGQ